MRPFSRFVVTGVSGALVGLSVCLLGAATACSADTGDGSGTGGATNSGGAPGAGGMQATGGGGPTGGSASGGAFTTGGASGSGGGAGVSGPEACEDMVDVLAAGFVRCAVGSYAQVRQDLENEFQCPLVSGVKDAKVLYDVCIPWYTNATCDELLNGFPPDVCFGMLL